mmetsp:Transcript_32816/g.71600  ORF Transcript_32816/g.71600 Transcript_32816/m.71600 type:complete len:90 (-) Transcript_32816:16-285(-)
MPTARKPSLMTTLFGACLGSGMQLAAPAQVAQAPARAADSSSASSTPTSAGGLFDLGRAAKERGQHILTKNGTLVSQQTRSSSGCSKSA